MILQTQNQDRTGSYCISTLHYRSGQDTYNDIRMAHMSCGHKVIKIEKTYPNWNWNKDQNTHDGIKIMPTWTKGVKDTSHIYIYIWIN